MFAIFVRDYYMASYLISKATKIGFLFLFQIVLCSLFSQAIPVIFSFFVTFREILVIMMMMMMINTNGECPLLQ